MNMYVYTFSYIHIHVMIKNGTVCMHESHWSTHVACIHWSIHIHADLTVAYDIHTRCLCRVLNLGFNALMCVPLSPSAKSGLTSYSGPGTLCGPWTFAFGGCSFSGNGNGAPLLRAGSCPTEVGELHLAYKSITVVPASSFEGMSNMT